MAKLEVLGVRGSKAVTGAEFSAYGGNTSCFALRRDGDAVIFDAGSGISRFRGSGRIHLLMTHLHMDHVVGLYGCPLLVDPNVELHIYGAADGGFERQLKAVTGAPYWPVGLCDLPAQMHFHELAADGSFEPFDGCRVRTAPSNHPNGCISYRVELDGRTIVYALDCETDDAAFARLVDFARGADLMVWDACYPPDRLIQGWGHSTWRQGAEVASAAGVGRVLMAHYSPDCTDEVVKAQEVEAAADKRCIFAKEGMEVTI